MYSNLDLRKIITKLAATLLVCFLLIWLWNYYHNGMIIITTDNPNNTISLFKTKDGAKDKKVKTFKAHSRLSVTVRAGDYVAIVEGGSKAIAQNISLKPRKTLRYNLNPVDTTAVESVAYVNAEDIAATADRFVYLDATSNTLFKIYGQNKLVGFKSYQQLQAVKWANASFGVGQDSTGRLYSITGDKVSLLSVPFSYGNSSVSFDVSRDGKIYIAYGANVYSGDRYGRFKKIYTATSSNPSLAAGGGQLAISVSEYGKNASNTSSPSLVVLKGSGQTNEINVEAERAAWSPGGQKLAVVNETNPVIYDASLNKTATIHTSDLVTQFAWVNDGVLLYATNDEVWLYSLSQQKSELISNMPFSDSITGLCVSDDRNYAYATTYNSFSSVYTLRRIGLRHQVVSDFISRLQGALPMTFTNFSVGMVNFSGAPTIVVEPSSGSSPGDSVESARIELASKGIDVSRLSFVVRAFD